MKIQIYFLVVKYFCIHVIYDRFSYFLHCCETLWCWIKIGNCKVVLVSLRSFESHTRTQEHTHTHARKNKHIHTHATKKYFISFHDLPFKWACQNLHLIFPERFYKSGIKQTRPDHRDLRKVASRSMTYGANMFGKVVLHLDWPFHRRPLLLMDS